MQATRFKLNFAKLRPNLMPYWGSDVVISKLILSPTHMDRFEFDSIKGKSKVYYLVEWELIAS